MMELNLGSFKIPLNAATKAFVILAKRGAGKTYAASVIAEEFFRAGVPFVAIDPIDVWWGLRFSSNGAEKGLPIVVFGIEHADIPLTRDMGKRIAQAIVRDGVSCIISTFGLSKSGQRQLVTDFAEELLRINNTPRHVFIEEAHEFVPQRVFGGVGGVFNAVSNLVVMGRNRGIGVTLVNQRAATLNKDVLTQVDAIIALRSVGPQDKAAMVEYAAHHGAEQEPKFNEFINSLPYLSNGEGWLWSPEFLQEFKRIKIRERETFHPDREKMGHFKVPALDAVEVDAFVQRFNAEAPKETGNKTRGEPRTEISASMSVKAQVTKLQDQYESRLAEKDSEINCLRAVIENVRRIVENQKTQNANPSVSRGTADFWAHKLGIEKAEGKIIKFLTERAGLTFSRSQITLAIGISNNSSTTSKAFSLLVRNKLLLKERRVYRINPEI